MAPEPAKTRPTRIEKAIKVIRARIHSLEWYDRQLKIALLNSLDADVTPTPDIPGTGLLAQLQQRTEPLQAASLHVRRLCLADQPAFQ